MVRKNEPTRSKDVTSASKSPGKVGKKLPLLPERQLSHSGAEKLSTCPRAYYLSGPGAWWGWESQATEIIQKRYLHKKTTGMYGAIGTDFHGWSARVHYSDIDRVLSTKTGVLPEEDNEMKDLFRLRFEATWRKSRQFRWDTFKATPNKSDVTWYLEHARRKCVLENRKETDDELAEDTRLKDSLWRWIEPCLDDFLLNRNSYMKEVSYKGLRNIEGRRIENGLIVSEPGHTLSQEELRRERVFPSTELIVDGERWKYSYTVDRLIWVEHEAKFYIIDFKTGKAKEEHIEQMGLYAALAVQDLKDLGIKEENLVLRLIYFKNPEGEKIQDYDLEPGDIEKFLERAKEQIRSLRKRLVPVEEVSRERLCELIPREYLFDTSGAFKSDEFPSGTLVALEEHFEPKAANEFEIQICKMCEMRELCSQGTRLLKMNF